MKKAIPIILLLSVVFQQAWAAATYKDFVVVDNIIWGLTAQGSIQLIDTKTNKPLTDSVKSDSEILVLSKDKMGNVVIVDKTNLIKRYNKKTQDWEIIGACTSSMFGLVFDSANNGYAITDKGIMDIESSRLYFTGKSINTSFRYNGKSGLSYRNGQVAVSPTFVVATLQNHDCCPLPA